MEQSNISRFLNKALEKTKNKELVWIPLSDTYKIKPLPDEDTPFPCALDEIILMREDSYMAKYKSGYLLLLAYRDTVSALPPNPPDNCKISLRVQDASSKYPIEITNNRESMLNASSLIRLYNLVLDSCSTISALVDDFLNS